MNCGNKHSWSLSAKVELDLNHVLLRSGSFCHLRSWNDVSHPDLLIALYLNLTRISNYVMDNVNVKIET